MDSRDDALFVRICGYLCLDEAQIAAIEACPAKNDQELGAVALFTDIAQALCMLLGSWSKARAWLDRRFAPLEPSPLETIMADPAALVTYHTALMREVFEVACLRAALE